MFNKKSIILVLVVGFTISSVSDTFGVEPLKVSANSLILAESNRILSNIKETEYAHTNYIDEENGIYKTNCSLLLTYILENVVPHALMEVPIEMHFQYPRASCYYEVIKNASKNHSLHWIEISSILEAEPGDIIAWRTIGPMSKDTNTGHVCVFLKKSELEPNGTVRVTIFDSTGFPHSDDIRKKQIGGVGVGTIWFEVDEFGSPVAYFKNAEKEKGVKKFVYAIGRVFL